MPAEWPADPWVQQTLTREQTEQYLSRIHLPCALVDAPPSLDLLHKIQVPHLETVIKDTSPLHVPEEQWKGPSTPIVLGSALCTMPESKGAFDRIYYVPRGINSTFAAFLRSFGFRISEVVSRTFESLNNDPETHEDGYKKWGTLTHEVLIADWPGSETRWLVDAAWGPWACPVPIKLEDGAQTLGLNPYEAFQLRHEYQPLAPDQTQPIDRKRGWTLYRFVQPPAAAPLSLPLPASPPPEGGFWSPQHHFPLHSVPLADFRLYHHFSASHELASFSAFWLVTRLLPGTGGARRSIMYAEKEGMPRRAKMYTTGGHEGKGSLEGRDVEWVEMETGPVREFLEREFEWGLP